jgi:hypothetical protein
MSVSAGRPDATKPAAFPRELHRSGQSQPGPSLRTGRHGIWISGGLLLLLVVLATVSWRALARAAGLAGPVPSAPAEPPRGMTTGAPEISATADARPGRLPVPAFIAPPAPALQLGHRMVLGLPEQLDGVQAADLERLDREARQQAVTAAGLDPGQIAAVTAVVAAADVRRDEIERAVDPTGERAPGISARLRRNHLQIERDLTERLGPALAQRYVAAERDAHRAQWTAAFADGARTPERLVLWRRLVAQTTPSAPSTNGTVNENESQ